MLLLILAVLFAGLAVPLGWWAALRIALCAMFLLTASAHWGKRRPDLIRMVPPSFPWPDLMVTFTGICEIAGAIGLLIPVVAPYAAVGLTLMLLAVFPANIHAARKKLTIGGTPVTPLVPRTIIQLILVTATIAVFLGAMQLS
jgi:uncharacterized membrane protein